MTTTIICVKCGEKFETDEIVSVGGLPQCEACGGSLTIPGALELRCCHCDYHTHVPQVDFKTCVACPECEWALDVVGQDLDALPPDPAAPPPPQEGETIALAPSSGNQVTEESETISPPPSPEQNETTPLDSSESSSSDLKTSSFFGKYHIIEEIARGGMGVVYKVRDPDLKRELALKVMIAGENASEDLLKRFLREARAAARINHPNVVAVHEVGNIEGQYYFTMDYVEGTSFDKIISGRWMPVDDTIRHIRDIALALKTAHDMNIIHRDLKPANIMYDVKQERALLTDFGLAKEMDGNTMLSMTGMMMGSPAYMSPEQAKGMVHETDSRTDIYSLGVILYETLTGEQPFSSETVVDTIRKTVYDDPVPPRQMAPGDVTKDMQNIIMKCLEKDPDNRYQDIKELANDLTAYLQGHKVRAKAIPLMKAMQRKMKKHPALFATLAISPFAAGGLLIAAWFIFMAPGKLDMAAEALASKDVKRQGGAVGDIAAWLRSKKIDSPADKLQTASILSSYLDHGDPEISKRVCLILEKLAEPASTDALVKLLTKPETPETLKTSAILALRSVASAKGADKATIYRAFIATANNKTLSPKLRLSAIQAIPDAWTRPTMKDLLKIAKNTEEDERLRAAAISAMGTQISVEMPEMNDILKFYGDDSGIVRKAAEKALQNIRNNASILDIYGISGNASSTAQAMGKMQKAVADNQRRLMDTLKSLNSPVVEKKVEKKKATPLEVISKKLKSNSPEERLAAAYDLGRLGDGKAVPLLLKVLLDPDADVVRVAGRSIQALYSKNPPEDSDLIPLLKHPNPTTREQAIMLLSNSDTTGSFEAISNLAKRERNMRVVRTLAKSLKRQTASNALPLLDELLTKSADKSASTAKTCVKSMEYFGEDAAPYLIKHLTTTNKSIKTAIIAALEEISGRTYGSDMGKWRKWLNKKTEE